MLTYVDLVCHYTFIFHSCTLLVLIYLFINLITVHRLIQEYFIPRRAVMYMGGQGVQ